MRQSSEIATQEIEHPRCEDIHKVLTFLGDLDRSSSISRITNNI